MRDKLANCGSSGSATELTVTDESRGWGGDDQYMGARNRVAREPIDFASYVRNLTYDCGLFVHESHRPGDEGVFQYPRAVFATASARARRAF